jgi:hypothetical protein
MHKANILPAVLYRCEIVSLIEERTTNRGSLESGEPTTLEPRGMNEEETSYLYTAINIITIFELRNVRWERHVAGTGEKL